MFQLISNYPRYAKVIDMGFKSGRMMNAADNAAIKASQLRVPTVPYATASGGNLSQAANLEKTAMQLTDKANKLGKVSERYSEFNRFDPQETANIYNDARKLGKNLNPYLSAAESITKPTLRLAGEAMMHPAGQMALFMGAPMLMMSGGGEEVPTEYYQQQPMDAYTPMSMPPQMPVEMMRSVADNGNFQQSSLPSSTLDEEQIRRARKRAEEQAALNQFYAQALQQYGGYQ